MIHNDREDNRIDAHLHHPTYSNNNICHHNYNHLKSCCDGKVELDHDSFHLTALDHPTVRNHSCYGKFKNIITYEWNRWIES